MKKINLSDFKAISRFKFVEGAFKKVEKKLEDSELEFFGVNDNVVKELTGKKIAKDDIGFLYDLIPIISNVVVDVDIEEFKKMCKIPSLQFASYIDLLLEHFKEIHMVSYKLIDLDLKVNNTINELGLEIPKSKTKDEKIEELYMELSKCTEDKIKRKEIFNNINILEIEKSE